MTAASHEDAALPIVPPPPPATPPPAPPSSPAVHPVAGFVAARPTLPLILVAGSGAVLLLLGSIEAIVHPSLARCLGMFLLLYAAIVAVSLMPSTPLGARVDRMLENWLRSSSAGFYGLMALALFLTLEGRDLIQAAAGFEFTQHQLWSIFTNWLIGFSVDSLMNTITASMWPWQLMRGNGAYPVVAMGVIGWCVYRGGAYVFPHVHQRLEHPRREKRKRAAKKTKAGAAVD